MTELPARIAAEIKALTAQHGRVARRSPGSPAPAVLFAGAAGTGKTMAAQRLAQELGLALRRVDLAAIESKYIGETEKALDHVFESAASSGEVLMLDEADALFGKRSEVKDSHDRYANVETAYLLARIEAHHGPVILTTHHGDAIDPALLRRLRLVEFRR